MGEGVRERERGWLVSQEAEGFTLCSIPLQPTTFCGWQWMGESVCISDPQDILEREVREGERVRKGGAEGERGEGGQGVGVLYVESSLSAAKWESHAEVAEMIELQQKGLAGKRAPDSCPGDLGDHSDHSNPEEGGESLDEGQWSSDYGDGGGEEVRVEGEGEPVEAAADQTVESMDDS